MADNPPYSIDMRISVTDVPSKAELVQIQTALMQALRACGYAVEPAGWGFHGSKELKGS